MNRLNYHHLHYFWRVAVTGNLTQVARDLHISQSALSAQIKQLEHTMGVSLFERVGRRLTLTDTGKRVLAYANDIFGIGEELQSFLKKGAVSEQQHLSIGVLTTLSRNFVERFISPLMTKPNVSFSLSSLSMDKLLSGLTNHELDLVLTNRPVSLDLLDAQWQTKLVSRQPLAIVGPKHQKISTTFPEGYENVRWVLTSKASETRMAFNAHCAAWQYEPNVQAESNDMAMLRLLARDTGALSVLPPVVVKDEIEQGILEEYQRIPDIFENFYAITTQRKFVPEIVLELLRQTIDT
ncbi:MAG: LysR family transcriptional regulator [Reinekea sp.]|nr:LysR family transcriptional regulator [Reinekea sp.]